MNDRTRRISSRLAAALAIACFSLAVPSGAFAEHRGHDRGYDRHDRRHDRHVRHGRHDRYDHRRHDRRDRGWGGHGFFWGRHHRPRPYRVHVHGSSCSHRRSDYGYYCRPCGQRYDDLDRLHHHVHHVHHIPFWRLPFVIIAKTMGFYYYG